MPRSGSDSTKFRRNDLILAGAVLLVSGALWLILSWSGKTGDNISIMVDGQLYGTYSLDEDKEIVIGLPDGASGADYGSTEAGGTNSVWRNVLKIQAGQASMIEADCPDLLCVHHKPISKQGESIVCLPHKVIVKVTGEEHVPAEGNAGTTTKEEEYDLLTR